MRPRLSIRLRLETLEDRTLPATLFVGTGEPFANLQDAIGAANPGDVIQVEPGAGIQDRGSFASLAAPAAAGTSQLTVNSGTVSAGELLVINGGVPFPSDTEYAIVNSVQTSAGGATATLAAPLKNSHAAKEVVVSTGFIGIGKDLTIQGDPGDFPSGLGFLSPVMIGGTPTQTGLTHHVVLSNLGLSDATLLGSGTTITNCQVSGSITSHVLAYSTGNLLPVGQLGWGQSFIREAALSYETPGAPGGDTIVANVIQGSIDLAMTANEEVAFNMLTGPVLHLDFPDGGYKIGLTNVTGADVRDNRITAIGSQTDLGDAPFECTVYVTGGSGITLAANSLVIIQGVASNTYGIFVLNTPQVNILNNVVNTNAQGTGLVLVDQPARVEGNDFHGNLIGIDVDLPTAFLAVAASDLGGGAQGSVGGNDLRDAAFNGTSIRAAIKLEGPQGATSTLSALQNLFNPLVPNPHALVADSSNGGVGTINVGSGTNANAAYVQSLYSFVLHRSGTPSEIGFWTSQLSTLGQAGVASGVIHSTERFQLLVEGFYRTFLRRAADATGEAFFENLFLQGRSEEAVLDVFLTSPEFQALVAQTKGDFNTAFVQAMYTDLLGRLADSTGLGFWLSQISSIGLSRTVDGFVRSLEYRNYFVTQLYTDLLHRVATPSAAELAGWSQSSLDLLGIQVQFVNSPEFFANG